MEAKILETYPNILADVNYGISLNNALQKSAVWPSRTSIFKWRWMAEMQIVDRGSYRHLRELGEALWRARSD
jgi:hypothetical protein